MTDLVRSLDDPRGYVRDWALNAVRQLPAELRDPPLRAALDTIRDAKTRAAVVTMLEPTAAPATR